MLVHHTLTFSYNDMMMVAYTFHLEHTLFVGKITAKQQEEK